MTFFKMYITTEKCNKFDKINVISLNKDDIYFILKLMIK